MRRTSKKTTLVRIPMRAILAVLIALITSSSMSSDAFADPRSCAKREVTITGTRQADVIDGTAGDDVIAALGGNDRVTGGTGRDRICGGRGDDIVSGGADVDRIRGGSGRDRLNSGVGWDFIHGQKGRDRLHGSAGSDELFGESGADALFGQGQTDFLMPGSGDDRLIGGDGRRNVAQFYDSPNPVRAYFARGLVTGFGRDEFRGINQINGSFFDDFMLGDERTNVMVGFAGDDLFMGRGGHDVFFGFEGDDELRGGVDNDIAYYAFSSTPVVADLSNHVAHGEGKDQLIGLEQLFGSQYEDTLIGNGKRNTFDNWFGDDHFQGKGGSDLFYRYNGDVEVRGGPGNDTAFYPASPTTASLMTGQASNPFVNDSLSSIENLWGSLSEDSLVGDDNPNKLKGGEGIDELLGAGGDDLIKGNEGDDLLDGSVGADDLSGGMGSDTCLNGEQVSGCESPLPTMEHSDPPKKLTWHLISAGPCGANGPSWSIPFWSFSSRQLSKSVGWPSLLGPPGIRGFLRPIQETGCDRNSRADD